MTYVVEDLDDIRRDLKSISKTDRERIRFAIEQKLTSNPIEFGKPLQFSLKGLRRLWVGDYRVIFQIDKNAGKVLIVKIGHGREIYEE